jgi:ATP-binding cassette subfamily B protein
MLSFAFSVGERKKKKNKEDRETLAVVFRLINDFGYKYAPRYAIAVAAMMVVAGATAFSAYLMKEVVDSVFVNQSREALFWVAGAIVAVFVVKGLASYVSEVQVGTIRKRILAQ